MAKNDIINQAAAEIAKEEINKRARKEIVARSKEMIASVKTVVKKFIESPEYRKMVEDTVRKEFKYQFDDGFEYLFDSKEIREIIDKNLKKMFR